MRRARTKAVISYQADVIARSQRQADLGSAERLRGWRDMVIAQATSQQGKGGCPLGSLAGQLALADPHARALLAGGFGQWQAALAEGLRRLHQAGQLPDGTDPEALAVTLLATLQGGLLLAQVQRDPRPLETAVDTLLQLARNGRPDIPAGNEIPLPERLREPGRCARPKWSGLTAACASGCFVRGRPTSPAPVEPPPVSLELLDMPGRFTAGGWQQHGPGTMESR